MCVDHAYSVGESYNYSKMKIIHSFSCPLNL